MLFRSALEVLAKGGCRCFPLLSCKPLLIRPLQAHDRRDAALVLLKDLVENQFPAFAGDELEVFELLFKLREDTSRTVRPPPSLPFGGPDQTLPRPSPPLRRSLTSSARASSRCMASDRCAPVSQPISPSPVAPRTQSRSHLACGSSASSSSASRARFSRTSCRSRRA